MQTLPLPRSDRDFLRIVSIDRLTFRALLLSLPLLVMPLRAPLADPPSEPLASPPHSAPVISERLWANTASDQEELAPQPLETLTIEDPAPSSEEQPLEETLIQIDPLTDIDPDSLGILNAQQGGMGEDMWAGTSRKRAHILIKRLPLDTRSFFLRRLIQRILLSNATAPAGEKGAESLVSQRIHWLYKMGDIAAMQALIDVTPQTMFTPSLSHILIDGLLLSGREEEVCQQHVARDRPPDEGRWRHLKIYCDLRNRQEEKARLGLLLLQESNREENDSFLALADSILDDFPIPPLTPSELTPLSLALLRLAPEPVELTLDEMIEPALLTALVNATNIPMPTRLIAAEQAEQLGLLPTQSLRSLYNNVSFPRDVFEQALQESDLMDPPLARAFLFQAAQKYLSTPPLAPAKILDHLYQQARQHGVYPTIARVSAPLILELEPQNSLIWFSDEAIMALLLAEETELALSWYPLLQRHFDPETSPLLAEIWLCLYIADDQNRLDWDSDLFASWLSRATSFSPPGLEIDEAITAPSAQIQATHSSEKAALMLALLSGLDAPLTGEDWAMVWQAPPAITEGQSETGMPSTLLAWLHGVQDAAQSQRVAETLLLAISRLNHREIGHTDPLILQEVITALRHIGFDTEARSIALEAALSTDG